MELCPSILSSYLFCKLSSEFSEAVASVGYYPQDDTPPSSSHVWSRFTEYLVQKEMPKTCTPESGRHSEEVGAWGHEW